MDKRTSFSEIFPDSRKDFWKRVIDNIYDVIQIRLRINQPVIIEMKNCDKYLENDGSISDRVDRAHIVSESELKILMQHICKYSVYAFEDEIRQGFVTVSGGHRIGLAGQIVLDERGFVRTIKHVTFVNIRIAQEIKGVADKIMPQIYHNGNLKNTLIISPPGCGKTTLLRDLVRQVSNGNMYGEPLEVALVDERSEIAGSYMGIPQNDVGIRTDVMDACPKEKGMTMLLRSMSPRVMAVDEIGKNEEGELLKSAALSGIKILATIHGQNREDAERKLGEQVFNLFEGIVLLNRQDNSFNMEWVDDKNHGYSKHNVRDDRL